MIATTRATLIAQAKTPTDDLFVLKSMVPVEALPVDGQERTIRFVISTEAVDRDNDTIDPKGWELAAYQKNPVVLWAHDYKALPVGRATSVVMRNGQLVSDCEFATHEFAETVFQLVKGGFLKATSVGFRPKKYDVNEQRHGLDFKEQELMEYSIVPVPSNPEALIDLRAAKAAGIDTEPMLAWAKAVLKTTVPPAPEGTAADDKASDTCEPVGGKCPSGYDMGADGMCHVVAKREAPPAEEKETDPPSDMVIPDPVCPADPEPPPVVVEDPPIEEAKHICRVCEEELVTAMPRLRDDLGIVCARCFLKAAGVTKEPIVDAPTAVAVEAFALDLDDGPSEDIAVELDEADDVIIDLTPDEVREALRSAVTSAVSTIVREETRAAFNRARGRVD